MSELLRDLRYAARTLARTPLFTLGVVLTLGLGIGVNAAMFGVVDTLFLRPPAGVHNADRIVRVYVRRTDPFFGTSTGATTNYPVFEDWRASGAFERVAGFAVNNVSLGRGADAQQIRVASVSHDYFPLLGVIPSRGRAFGPDEDKAGGERVVVLTDAFWRSHYGADAGVLGRAIPLGRAMATVIGIAPPGFTGIEALEPVDAFMPISAAAGDQVGLTALTSRGWWWMSAIARVAPGKAELAAARATAVYRHGMTPHNTGDSNAVVVLGPIQAARGPEASSESKVSWWIGLVAIAVLLIACANVANLLLARGVARRRELAVRAGLGAGRGGLIRMLLAESAVLSLVGGAAAILLAAWTGAAARTYLIPDAPKNAAVVDLRVLLFTALAVALTAVLIGLVPAVQASRTDLSDALKSGGRGATGRGGRTRAALLVFQVALTLVLLVGAGLFVRSLRNVQHIDLGFDAQRVLEASVDMNAAGLGAVEANATYLRLLDRIQHLGGVADAAGTMAPFGWGFASSMRAEGVDSMPQLQSGGPYFNAVTPGYFATLGTPLVRGRLFSASDVAGAERVTVVNASFARLVWPRAEAIGKCLYLGSDTTTICTRVVGVVGDVKRGSVTESGNLIYYLPFAQLGAASQQPPKINALVVRGRVSAAAVSDAVRREIQVAGNLPYARVRSLADRISPQYRSWRLGAAAFTAFGALGLAIAAMGIFAVISYGVTQRTHEIGIRMALGAEARTVARMVLGQGLRAAGFGLVLGAAGAWALGRGIRALLYEVQPADPLVFGVVAVTLLAVASAAAYLPARRAARVDPMVALRAE